MSDCLFCKIVAREIPADIIHESDITLAFRDIAPKAPTHVLVIPKAHYPDMAAMAAADATLAGQVLATVATVADSEGLARGYRTIFNSGRDGGQEVFHVHAHLLGGGPLGFTLA